MDFQPIEALIDQAIAAAVAAQKTTDDDAAAQRLAELQKAFDDYKAKWPPVVSTPTTPTAPTTPTKPTTPQPVSTVLLGAYNGGPATDDAVKTALGFYPQLASSYYQGGQTINVAAEKARVAKGIRPFLTVTSKGSGYTLAQIGSGAADGWIDAHAAAAAAINAPLFLTLDHEFEVKLNQNQFTPAPTYADYAAAYSRFRDRVKAKAPLAQIGHWFGGSDKTKIEAIGSKLTGADWYAYDPYKTETHPAGETFEQTVTPTLTWLKARTWYKGQPIFLGEFGCDLRHGDDNVAGYMTDLRPKLLKLGLAGALHFNRNKTDADGQVVAYKLDTGTSPKALAAFTASARY